MREPFPNVAVLHGGRGGRRHSARRVPGRLPKRRWEPVPRWGWRSAANEAAGKPVPFLRWSFTG